MSEQLFGTRSAGWSDRFSVHVTEMARATPLGPCAAGGGGTPPPPPPHPAGSCMSNTLGEQVGDGTCVQSASDGAWYRCANGSWIAGDSACSASFAWCQSSTLGRGVPSRTCVQSKSDRLWYQCDNGIWTAGVTNGAGQLGTCSTEYSL